MSKKPSKSKMGRPPLPADKRRGASMGFRPTPEIREKLAKAAEANGRSLSQEVEARLERSFVEEDPLTRFFGGRDRFLIALAIVRWVESAEELTGRKWLEDDYTYQTAVDRIVKFFYQGSLFLGESHQDFPAIPSPLGAGHLRVPWDRHREKTWNQLLSLERYPELVAEKRE